MENQNTFTITFTEQELNTVLQALSNVAYGQIYQIFNKIETQTAAQAFERMQKNGEPIPMQPLKPM